MADNNTQSNSSYRSSSDRTTDAINGEAGNQRDSLASGAENAGAGMDTSSDRSSTSEQWRGQDSNRRGQTDRSSGSGFQAEPSASGDNALDVLRGSVVGVLDSVVREYEPQIATFTSNIAHQAVDRGVELAQTAVQRVKSQSWMRLGIAAALGIGIIAVLGYEAEQAASDATGGEGRSRKALH